MKDNKGTSILIAALVIILFFGGIAGAYYIGKLRAENSAFKNAVGDNLEGETGLEGQGDPLELAQNVAPITEDDHILGNTDAKIALIEYSDYTCSFCALFKDTAKQIVEDYDGEVMWVYRHFPLGPVGQHAATASECVANLAGNDAFWAFTDTIFDNQDQVVDEASVDAYALNAGIDETEYNNCINSNEANIAVSEDFDNGQQSGIQGTPGIIVLNTETGELDVIPGALPLEDSKEIIDSLL